jgi:cytochrome bd-type quinol oxidase subunit 2
MTRFFSFACLLFLLPTFVLAQATDSAPPVPTPTQQPSTGVASVAAGIDAASQRTGLQNFCHGSFQSCVEIIVGGVINIALSLVGVILLGYTLYAGFLWMTSGGEKDQAEEAMKMIRQAVIGLLIVIMSFVISSYIVTALGNISQGQLAPPPGATTPAAGTTPAPTPTPTPTR